jgi:hypothetical protein
MVTFTNGTLEREFSRYIIGRQHEKATSEHV